MSESFKPLESIITWIFDEGQCKQNLSNRTLKQVTSYKHANSVVCDIKLQAKGYEEEKLFSENSLIRFNIRRGNSLMLVFKDANETIENIESACWVRRGLMKFFDVSYDQVNLELGKSIKPLRNKRKNKKKSVPASLTHSLTFSPIEKSFASGQVIDLYYTEKANGENVQVSFIGLVDKWIVSSKNCSVVISDIQDLSNYADDRYSFTKLIARTFFDILKNVNDIESLKKYLRGGKTLVGEYIGNKEFQHIVKYSEETIKFYAIVENCSCDPCVPVLETVMMLKKFNIPAVKVRKIGSFENKIELFVNVKKVFKSVSGENLEQGGEGTVLYFVENRGKGRELDQNIENFEFSGQYTENPEECFKWINETQTVLTLAKIKTVEYRILRKIREKVKNLQDGPIENYIKTFEQDCKELLEKFNLDSKLAYYVEHFRSVAEAVLRKKKKNKKTGDLNEIIGKNLPVVFLETSWESYIDKSSVQERLGLEYDSNKSTSKFIEGHLYHNIISRNNCPLVANAYYFILGFDEISEQKFFTCIKNFQKTEDFPKELQKFTKKKDASKLNKKIHEYYKAKRKLYKDLNFPESGKVFMDKAGSDLEIFQYLKKELSLNKPKNFDGPVKIKAACYVFFSISIPGSGKTYISNYFSDTLQDMSQYIYKYIDYTQILNDKIHSSESEDSIKVEQDSENLTQKRFFEDLKREICTWIESYEKILVIYIENNFSISEFQYAVRSIKEIGNKVKVIGMIPKSFEFHLTKKLSFTVSPSFLLICLKRKVMIGIQKNWSIEEILSMMLRVVSRFKELNISYYKALEKEVDESFAIYMANEDSMQIDDQILKLLRKIIQSEIIEAESLRFIYEFIQKHQIHELNFFENFKKEFNRSLT